MPKLSIKWASFLFIVGSAAVMTHACKTPLPESELRDDLNSPGSGGSTYDGPPGSVPAAQNAQVWGQYCKGVYGDVSVAINPNYQNADMLKAAKILSTIKGSSFKMYKDILKMHETTLPAGVTGVNKDAHNFLTYLCGEFRDRASMIKAKVQWIFNIRYLASGGGGVGKSCIDRNDPLKGNMAAGSLPATRSFDRNGSPWAQMCIEDYEPYLAVSRAVFDEREALTRNDNLELEDGTSVGGPLKIGERDDVDRHVPGFSVCETKYIMAEFVKKQREYQTYQDYTSGYTAFKAACTADDLGWYYDFRGDSNYKPNSPEGNAMIWMAKVFAAQCQTRVKAKSGAALKDTDCKRYYEQPFKSRFLAARAGLGAWLLHDTSLTSIFGNPTEEPYTVVNHSYNNPKDFFSTYGPFFFRYYDVFEDSKLTDIGKPAKYLPGFEGRWGERDFGLAKLSGLSGDKLKYFIFNRLQMAVDRHTNWYASSYDSAPTLPLTSPNRRIMDQAFSPFVASSYEMSESNNFTQCGLTIPCSGSNAEFNDHKHWMFIFKVKRENWFRPEDILAGNTSPDFDRIWIDETSFGDDDLANRERAWDRLGTPMEDEHAEILYLWRIPSGQ